ncbi:MAG: bifunctional nuclease domain-containing protein [Planctomycetaceae bacterium]|nr:DUF151 domain-containing protein [Planctomycetaceae bacterium]
MDIPVELSRILITELGDQQVIFLREKSGDRSFPILIGTNEALAIDRRLKGQLTPRPMTHDLLATVIDVMGGRLERIVINDIRDHTFIATIYIAQGEKTIEVDARPSDAIALGTAQDTPIFVSQHVLDNVTNGPPTKNERLELLRHRLAALEQAIGEVTERLNDNDFISQAPADVISQLDTQLEEMRREHDAIDRVLKKLG